MAFLELYREKLRHNYKFLSDLFEKNTIEWGITTKLLCGNETFLKEVIDLKPKQIADSRISNLRMIKKLDPDVQTVYIKPPAVGRISEVVEVADASFNTELETIKALSAEAGVQGKLHKIVIMIEMGDLREGVMRDDLIDFYRQIFELPNIEVVGIGTNLNCLHGVMPSEDKLIQLSLYKNIIELKFNRDIPWVSGGTTVTIPLIFHHQLPVGINHFRVGEALFFGADLFTGGTIEGMYDDVFELAAEIIEVTEKPVVPHGELGMNPMGEIMTIEKEMYGKTAHRAILDIGQLDLNQKFLLPINDDLEIVGASSDMLVVDLGDSHEQYSLGDVIRFRMKYMGTLGAMNSNYIDKIVREEEVVLKA